MYSKYSVSPTYSPPLLPSNVPTVLNSLRGRAVCRAKDRDPPPGPRPIGRFTVLFVFLFGPNLFLAQRTLIHAKAKKGGEGAECLCVGAGWAKVETHIENVRFRATKAKERAKVFLRMLGGTVEARNTGTAVNESARS